MAPRLLFDDQYIDLWQGSRDEGELNLELVDSATWRELVNNPRLRIYETGRLDDRMIGGDRDYGKLHAKYSVSELSGFLGTSNFDYRSRLYNNEMGFFFRSDELTQDILEDFELLKSKSLQWGSPEWLEMRQRVVEMGGVKGWTTKHQGSLFRFLRATGLKWYF
jgi:putative cardiolipin synthase